MFIGKMKVILQVAHVLGTAWSTISFPTGQGFYKLHGNLSAAEATHFRQRNISWPRTEHSPANVSASPQTLNTVSHMIYPAKKTTQNKYGVQAGRCTGQAIY